MQDRTQRELILEILLSADSWTSRQDLIRFTGFDKGYSRILGASHEGGDPDSWKAQGLVEVKNEDGRVYYRLTQKGRREFGAAHRSPSIWRKTVVALRSLGGTATRGQIRQAMLREHPSYDDENLRKDLDMLSVNEPRRAAYLKTLKLGDPRNAMVHLSGEGEESVYTLYDPLVHGIWVVPPDSAGKLRSLSAPADLGVERCAEEPLEEFDPRNATDAKRYVERSIAARRGQQAFRQALLDLYEGECSLSGCRLTPILEAAHIVPYADDETHHRTNGLLLRTDLHTLFDLGLLRIDPVSLRAQFHSSALTEPTYSELDGRVLKPVKPSPSSKSLQHHRDRHAAVWLDQGTSARR